MGFPKLKVLLAGAVFFTGACSFDEDLWPSLNASDPAGQPTAEAAQPAAAAQSADAGNQTAAPAPSPADLGNQPALGQTSFVPAGVTPGDATGTFVGKKVQELRGELQKLLPWALTLAAAKWCARRAGPMAGLGAVVCYAVSNTLAGWLSHDYVHGRSPFNMAMRGACVAHNRAQICEMSSSRCWRFTRSLLGSS